MGASGCESRSNRDRVVSAGEPARPRAVLHQGHSNQLIPRRRLHQYLPRPLNILRENPQDRCMQPADRLLRIIRHRPNPLALQFRRRQVHRHLIRKAGNRHQFLRIVRLGRFIHPVLVCRRLPSATLAHASPILQQNPRGAIARLRADPAGSPLNRGTTFQAVRMT
jgi:hypothetical protein